MTVDNEGTSPQGDHIEESIPRGLTCAINSLDTAHHLQSLKEPVDHEKIKLIEEVITSKLSDIERLRELATSNGGLVTDQLRRLAWPQLMMVGPVECTPKPSPETVLQHKDYQQVLMDVNRSLKRFPPGIEDDHRLVLMEQLTTLIIRVLLRHPELHYYQGFHDVAITFLLVVGEDLGYELVERLSMAYLRDFMRPTMEKTTYYLTYLYPILDRSNPKLCKFLKQSGVGTVFCLPWLITWFAHTLADYRNVVRLYDFFLSSPYLMPMYTAAAIVMNREDAVLQGECDMAMQHQILSQVADSLPFEDLLIKAKELYDLYPPDSLTDDVNKFIEEKKREEEEETKQFLLKKNNYRRGVAKKPSSLHTLEFMSRYLNISPSIIKLFAFALAATFATSLYGYITRSPSLTPYFSWNW